MANDDGKAGRTYLLVIAAVVAVLFAVAPKREPSVITPSPPAADRPVADWQYEARARTLVTKLLKDSDSAKFTELRVSRISGAPIVCGLVNSRNSLGGMAGNQRFVSGSVAVLEEQANQGEMDKLWARLC